ncbi:unnamed protein product [Paramecium pentaurelia]|uniref:Uncharacterized protein n=1 Tax=Paramecium pentaurelia TaxID=43138 RepID=A0A8S1VUI4_9CILI|nr:unnamed protein product [Paramecium pentaurelia]
MIAYNKKVMNNGQEIDVLITHDNSKYKENTNFIYKTTK